VPAQRGRPRFSCELETHVSLRDADCWAETYVLALQILLNFFVGCPLRDDRLSGNEEREDALNPNIQYTLLERAGALLPDVRSDRIANELRRGPKVQVRA
jgi:hypothetical protein